MAEETQKKQVRNVLWCIPRTLSTAMMRAMHNKTGCVARIEPFARSYYLGEDRISKRFVEYMPPMSGFKYTDVLQEYYHAQDADKSVVFCKDMAHFIVQAAHKGLYKLEDLIPKNFIHTFLIRKPEKAIKSMYQMFASKRVDVWNYWTEEEAGYKELWELYSYVKEHIDPNPLVIDADDLITDPVKYMHLYCDRLGIEFEDSMINWNPDDGLAAQLAAAGPWAPFWEGATLTNSFVQNTPAASRAPAVELPPEVLQCIEDSKPYYEKLLAVATRL